MKVIISPSSLAPSPLAESSGRIRGANRHHSRPGDFGCLVSGSAKIGNFFPILSVNNQSLSTMSSCKMCNFLHILSVNNQSLSTMSSCKMWNFFHILSVNNQSLSTMSSCKGGEFFPYPEC
jgi:hypothetical protein